MNNTKYSLRTITEKDYDFIYQVKKDAYKKYVEMNFGEWKDELQRDFFKIFMEKYSKRVLASLLSKELVQRFFRMSSKSMLTRKSDCSISSKILWENCMRGWDSGSVGKRNIIIR